MSDCPVCRRGFPPPKGQYNALKASKAGLTYQLCEQHKESARRWRASERRAKIASKGLPTPD